MIKMFGLYVHIPFCKNICSYCDFYKMRAKASEKIKYMGYLTKEIALLKKEDLPPIQTIYIGGGTPSSLPITELRTLFIHLDTITDLQLLKEFTIELNPEDITVELASLLKEFHLSRLSIGIQSFDPYVQEVLGRHHQYDDLKDKVLMLRNLGFNNLNFDYIYGIPETNLIKIKNDLDLLLSLKPQHLSCYSLILEEKTMLFHQFRKGFFNPIDEDLEAKMYDTIKDYLSSYGFVHYETSNFALPGYESLHNLIYWSNNRYRGIGAGSSSYVGNRRFKTISNLKKYYEGIDQGIITLSENITLTVYDQMKEEVMLGLRKTQGINLSNFYERYNYHLIDVFPKIKAFLDQKALILSNNFLAISPDKQYVANYILREIL